MAVGVCQRNRGVCNRSVTLPVLPGGEGGTTAGREGIPSIGMASGATRPHTPRLLFIRIKSNQKAAGDSPRPPLRGFFVHWAVACGIGCLRIASTPSAALVLEELRLPPC